MTKGEKYASTSLVTDSEVTKTQAGLTDNDQQRLDRLTLMDNDFFTEVLDGKKKAVQHIVNVVLERNDLRIVSTETEATYNSALKRSIRLDVRAEDTSGRSSTSRWNEPGGGRPPEECASMEV